MKSETSPSNLGAVVSVHGSAVDILFDAYLPPIYSLLPSVLAVAGSEG
jgi:F-type H+/Na+-transporting ATPase subunit beta